MIIAAFDTETTGKAEFRLDPSHPSQPRVVQLAVRLFDDSDGKEISSVSMLIKPNGWTVGAEAEKIHGISTEYADAYGIRAETAMRVWAAMLRAANRHIAHNIDFDWLMFKIEMDRLDLYAKDFEREQFCTMRKSTDICRIPGPRGFKWPTLAEAYQHFTKKPMSADAHDAMVDVCACIEVYQGLMEHESLAGDRIASAAKFAQGEMAF